MVGISLLPLIFLVESTTEASKSDAHAIYEKLFTDYNKNLRSVFDQKTKTDVIFDPGLFSIDEVNPLKETVTLTQWMWFKWKDEFLRWNPYEFGNVNEITVPATVYWIPDVVVLGALEIDAILPTSQTFSLVKFDGQISVAFLRVIKIHCDFDIKMFPFDTQTCILRYGSWEYNAREIDIFPMLDGYGITEFQQNMEWIMEEYNGTRVFVNDTDDSFVELHYKLVIRRRPAYYIFSFVVPSYVITTLAIIGLFSPFDASGEREEKVTMGLTTLLTMAVLLLLVAEQMPKTQEGLPQLGEYILWEIIIVSVATGFTVLILNLHRQAIYGKKPPRWLLRMALLPAKIGPKKENEEKPSLFRDYIRGMGSLNRQVSTESQMDDLNQSASSHLTVQVLAQSQLAVFHLRKLTDWLDEKEKEKEIMDLWRRVTERLDICFLAIFVLANTLLTLFMMPMISHFDNIFG